MKKMFAVLAVLVATAMTFVACGGSDSGGGVSAPPTTTVATPAQGAQAAAVGSTAAVNVVQGSVGLTGMINSSQPARKFSGEAATLAKVMKNAATRVKKAKAFAAKVPQTTNCSVSGTMTVDYPTTQTPPMTLSMSYANCVEPGMKMNGSETITVGTTSISITMNMTETGYTDTTNATVSYIDTMNQTVSMSQSGNTVTISLNGSESSDDKITNTKESNTFTNVSFTGTDNTDYTVTDINGYPTTGDMAMTVNGSIAYTKTVNGSVTNTENMSFYNLRVTDVWTSTTETTTINGTFSSDVYPNDPCTEGTYSFKTIVPMVMDATGMTTAGQIEINGTVVVTFLSDGSITVAISGGAPTSYTAATLATMCANL